MSEQANLSSQIVDNDEKTIKVSTLFYELQNGFSIRWSDNAINAGHSAAGQV